MNSETDTGTLVCDARPGLAGLLEAIKRARADYEEILARQRRLDGIKQTEAKARAKLETIRARDAREMSEQIANPPGQHITIDYSESVEAEQELACAARAADVARACEPEVAERLMKVGTRLAELETSVTHRAADVALEEAAEIAREIDDDAARLRAKYARLWGLWVFLGDAKLHHHAERAAKATHPDNICPSGAEVHGAAPTWRNFTERLAIDSAARLEHVK